MTQEKTDRKPRKRLGKLKSASDVARYMAKCIRRTEGGGDENVYYKRVMMASMLLKALEVSALEERVSRLESVARVKSSITMESRATK
jgi:hypothetical protein